MSTMGISRLIDTCKEASKRVVRLVVIYQMTCHPLPLDPSPLLMKPTKILQNTNFSHMLETPRFDARQNSSAVKHENHFFCLAAKNLLGA
jgi:hypothetical protein